MGKLQKQILLEEYAKKEHLYVELAFLIRSLLEGFLRANNFKFQIFHRAKDKQSLKDKLERKIEEGKEYKSLDEIKDLAGVRIVFYLEDDEKNFLQLFFREFGNCIIDEKEEYDPKGYRGSHFIFSLNKERVALIEYSKYSGLKCEIQISTILFHAWSEVEHDIIYKPKGNKQLLKELGLDELKRSFEKIMIEHLQTATYQLNYLNKKYRDITRAGKIFGSDFITDISLSKDNDNIYDVLEIVEAFYDKKLEEILAIVSMIVNKKPLPTVLLRTFGRHKLYGKSHKDLVLKSCDILDRIKYSTPDEVLELLAQLSLSDDQEIKNESLRIIENFARYDFNILTKTKIGYGAQRKVFDFILAWSIEEQLEHIDFVERVTMKLLSSSAKGETPGLNENADYTLTMHFGVVDPTDFLRKMRREVIDLIYTLFQSISNPKLKLRLINILNQATDTPSSVSYGEDIAQMISEDLIYLINLYRKIIFQGGKIIEDIGLVAVIEERLYWLGKSRTTGSEELEQLRSDILGDEFYKLFILFVGDPIIYREEKGWEEAEKIRDEEINKLIDIIDEETINEWFEKLDKVANQQGVIDEWRFNPFKTFLYKLSEKKPKVAEKILEKALDNNSSLKDFMTSFLGGFRMGTNFIQWDKFTRRIIDAQDPQFINAIIFSLNLPPDVDLERLIREVDIELLENIVRRVGEFSFLKELDNMALHYALINTLGRNFERSPKRIELLIAEEIKNNTGYVDMFFRQLPMMIHSKWFEIKDLHSETVKMLQEQMIKLSKIDWHSQELLLEIGKRDGLIAVLNLFMERIKKDIKDKEGETGDINEIYEALPYHLNPELEKFIAEHPDYEKIVTGWLADMTSGWSIYNSHMSHFLQRIGNGFSRIVTSLIEKGGDKNLMKAARVMQSINSVDFDLSIEIIRRTDNKRIINLVENNMFTTGIVSGEDGLAKAFEKKAERIETYKRIDDERVKVFVKRMVKNFQEKAKRERRRIEKERQTRKEEYNFGSQD